MKAVMYHLKIIIKIISKVMIISSAILISAYLIYYFDLYTLLKLTYNQDKLNEYEEASNEDNLSFWDDNTFEYVDLYKKPLIRYYPNFLREGEAEHLINLGKDRLEYLPTDQFRGNYGRTSSTAYFKRYESDILNAVEARIVKVFDRENIKRRNDYEGVHLIKYEYGQEFKNHYDWAEERSIKEFHIENQRYLSIYSFI